MSEQQTELATATILPSDYLPLKQKGANNPESYTPLKVMFCVNSY